MCAKKSSEEDSESRDIYDEMNANCDRVRLVIANDVEKNINDLPAFYPLFMHQIIDDENESSENGPSITLAFSPFFDASYTSWKGEEKDENLKKALVEYLPTMKTTKQEFYSAVKCTSQTIPGKYFNGFKHENHDEFVIYSGNFTNKSIVTFYNNIQILSLFFIDGSSILDTDDDKWNLYFLFLKKGSRLEFIGYGALYHYYAFPDKIRPRVGQFLILPPYQRKGIGKLFLLELLKYYQSLPNVLDIAMEDPSEDFQYLWDLLHCEFCLKLDEFKNINEDSVLDTRIISTCRNKFKLFRSYTHRVHEILKIKYVFENQCSEKKYQDQVLLRLNAPIEREKRRLKKLENFAGEKQMASMMFDMEQRRIQNEELYPVFLKSYIRVAIGLGLKI